MNEAQEPTRGAPMPGGTFMGRQKSISLERRRELLNLAQQAADWIAGNGIKSEELCLFRAAVEMLVDTRT